METCGIGMDIGGTFIRIGTVTVQNQLLAFETHDSKLLSKGPPQTAINDLEAFIRQYIERNHILGYRGIAVAFPGTIDPDRKILYSASNLGENAKCRFDNLDIGRELTERFGVPCFLGKDTDYLLRCDVHTHKLDASGLIGGIYFGTGIGSSFIYHGESFYGKNGVAGEIGHLPISERNLPCTCGHRGCCESIASGWRLRQIHQEFFPETPLDNLFEEHRNAPPLQVFINDISRVISVTGNLLDCNTTVIGGGILAMAGFPRDQLVELTMEKLRSPYPRNGYDLIFSTTGQKSGVLGAAYFLFDHFKLW